MTEQTQQAQTEVTQEQKDAALAVVENGRVADLEKAAQELVAKEAASKRTAEQVAADEAAIEKDKEEAAAKDKAEAENTAEGDASKWKEQWVEVGNDHADAAITLMKSKGISPVEGNAIFAEAIEAGDITKVKWDVLEARLADPSAFLLIKTGITAYYDTEFKEQQAVVDYAYEGVGGKDNWGKIQAWAEKTAGTDKAFAKERTEWQKALKVGGFAARAAVDAIKSKYEASNGTANPALTRGTTVANGATDVTGLSRAAYFQELEKAGGDKAPKHVVDAINARRKVGISQGM